MRATAEIPLDDFVFFIEVVSVDSLSDFLTG